MHLFSSCGSRHTNISPDFLWVPTLWLTQWVASSTWLSCAGITSSVVSFSFKARGTLLFAISVDWFSGSTFRCCSYLWEFTTEHTRIGFCSHAGYHFTVSLPPVISIMRASPVDPPSGHSGLGPVASIISVVMVTIVATLFIFHSLTLILWWGYRPIRN